jgi:hypothetical protein
LAEAEPPDPELGAAVLADAAWALIDTELAGRGPDSRTAANCFWTGVRVTIPK